MGSLVPKNNIINYYFVDKNEINPKTGRGKRKAIPLKNPATGEPLRPKNRDDQRIAKELKKEYDYKFSRVTFVKNHHYPFGKAFDDFLASKKETSKSYKAIFTSVKQDFIKLFGDQIFVRDINTAHINKLKEYWQIEREAAHNTIVSYLIHLRIFFLWLSAKNYFEKDIPVDKGLKIEEKEIIVIPEDEIKLILKHLKGYDKNQYNLINFLYMTGFRVGEAIALTWEQIDFNNKVIRFKNIKGKRIDDFPLYPDLEKFLQSFRQNTGKLFIYKSTETVRFFPRLMRSAKKNEEHPLYNKLTGHYTLHDIRRTFASDLVSNKTDIYEVKKLMRHRSIRTTEKHYAKMKLDTLSETAQRLSKIRTKRKK